MNVQSITKSVFAGVTVAGIFSNTVYSTPGTNVLPGKIPGTADAPSIQLVTKSRNQYSLFQYSQGGGNSFFLCAPDGVGLDRFTVMTGDENFSVYNLSMGIPFKLKFPVPTSVRTTTTRHDKQPMREIGRTTDELTNEEVMTYEFDGETVYTYTDGRCRVHQHHGKLSKADAVFKPSQAWVEEDKKSEEAFSLPAAPLLETPLNGMDKKGAKQADKKGKKEVVEKGKADNQNGNAKKKEDIKYIDSEKKENHKKNEIKKEEKSVPVPVKEEKQEGNIPLPDKVNAENFKSEIKDLSGENLGSSDKNNVMPQNQVIEGISGASSDVAPAVAPVREIYSQNHGTEHIAMNEHRESQNNIVSMNRGSNLIVLEISSNSKDEDAAPMDFSLFQHSRNLSLNHAQQSAIPNGFGENPGILPYAIAPSSLFISQANLVAPSVLSGKNAKGSSVSAKKESDAKKESVAEKDAVFSLFSDNESEKMKISGARENKSQEDVSFENFGYLSGNFRGYRVLNFPSFMFGFNFDGNSHK